jgi:hypothetical protein
MSTLENNDPAPAPQNTCEEHNRDPTPSEVLNIASNWLRTVGPEWVRRWLDNERPKSPWTDICMVVLTIVIAVAAIYSAWVFQGQLTEARNATQLAENQWRGQRVPWVGFANDMGFVPALDFFWGMQPHVLNVPQATMTVAYTIKNFGNSPAFAVAEDFRATAVPAGDYESSLPSLHSWCHGQDPFVKMRAKSGAIGKVVFPAEELPRKQEVAVHVNAGQTHVQVIELSVCITYMDSWDTIHHSEYFYQTNYSESGKPVAPNAIHPEWTFRPITSAYAMGAQAD